MTSSAILRPSSFATRSSFEDDRNALFDIIYERSFGRGDITLSSGKKSDFYFDMKPSMLDAKGAHLMAKLLLAEVVEVGGDYVGGLEMGAVPITGAVCAYSHVVNAPINGFFVRKTAKEHGSKKRVEGFARNENLRDKKLVVIDDVTTSGASALLAVVACREAGADVLLVVSILDRGEGASETFAAENINFKSIFHASDFLNRSL
ncbi:MAG: orotate phosphoribosyltransferase [Roseiarcus sp.]